MTDETTTAPVEPTTPAEPAPTPSTEEVKTA